MTEQNAAVMASKLLVYGSLALEWVATKSDSKKANKLFFELHRLWNYGNPKQDAQVL